MHRNSWILERKFGILDPNEPGLWARKSEYLKYQMLDED
jgi:hypothetical protein